MSTYLLRKIVSRNNEKRQHAIVVADTEKDLFWSIDELGDPREYEFIAVGAGAIVEFNNTPLVGESYNASDMEACDCLIDDIQTNNDSWARFSDRLEAYLPH